MKKYALLLWLTATVTLLTYSQSLSLSDSTGPLVNNATVFKYGLPSADEIVSHVFVKNTTAGPVAVKVKKVELMALEGTLNLLCWGLCFTPEVFVSPDSLVIESDATNTNDFSGHYVPQEVVGISTIRYVFFINDNPSDSVCVNFNYDTYPQGISNPSAVSFANAFPNPANNAVSFSFNIPQDSDTHLIIRNLLGTVVRDVNITGNSGKLSINTSDMSDGVYFYTFRVKGISQVTKKLVIRH